LIHYIKGVVTQTLPGIVVVENGGLGYEVHVADNSPAYLTKEGEVITIFTCMIVREDDISLYGFTDTESLSMFNLLMTVNGVGAKAALSILSALNVSELKKAIAFEDAGAITKANGIGKKIAQRVVLELKDKVGDAADLPASENVKIEKGSAKEEAVSALMALGYSKTEAMSLLLGITEKDLTTEEYIKRALKARR